MHKKAINAYKRTKTKKTAFYVHKKQLRGRKSLVCVLCFFVPVKSSPKKKRKKERGLKLSLYSHLLYYCVSLQQNSLHRI